MQFAGSLGSRQSCSMPCPDETRNFPTSKTPGSRPSTKHTERSVAEPTSPRKPSAPVPARKLDPTPLPGVGYHCARPGYIHARRGGAVSGLGCRGGCGMTKD